MHAFMVENHPNVLSTEKIIAKNCRLNPKHVSATMISSNNANNMRNIQDEESRLIDAFEIDEISEIINKETERLISLEIKYGM